MSLIIIRAGEGGSEGWVLYEVNVGGRLEKFSLNFADPASPWRKNYLNQWSSNDQRLRVKVDSYETSGHPFYGRLHFSDCIHVATLTMP